MALGAVALVCAVIPFVENGLMYALVLPLLLCAAIPTLLAWQRGRLDMFEPIHVLLWYYFVIFGLAAIWVVGDPENVAYDAYIVPYVPQAVIFCLFGFVAMIAGYYGPWLKRVTKPTHEYVPMGALFILIPGALGLAGYMASALRYRAHSIGFARPGLAATVSQLAPLYLFAWAMIWLVVLAGRATRDQRRAFYLFFLPSTALIASMSLNDKSLLVELIGVPLICVWYARGKLPWKSFATLLLVLVFVIMPFANTFRGLDVRIGSAQRMSMTSEIIGDWSADRYLDRSLGTFKARLAFINSVAVVIRDVPRWVPYAKGEGIFVPAVVFLVPRVLWKDKPVLESRAFAETFRVVHILDRHTRVGATLPGELYWNFGLLGIIVGLGLWGMTLRLLYRRYGDTPGLDPIRRAIHVLMVFQVIHYGAIAPGAVGMVRTLILLEAMLWIGLQSGLVQRSPVPTDPDGTEAAPAAPADVQAVAT